MSSRSLKTLKYQQKVTKNTKNFQHFQNIKNLAELKSDIVNSGLAKSHKLMKPTKEMQSAKTTREESSLNLKSKKCSS